jgi:glutamate carboxypeptidase
VTDVTLLDRLRGEVGEVIQLVTQLVQLESPSQDKQRVDRLGEFVAERIKRLGPVPSVESRTNVGDIVWVDWEGGGDGAVLVLCHLDTVWPVGTLERNPLRAQGGRLFGPGVFDMKAGIAATLKIQEYMAVGWIRPKRKVRFLYTTDEETGSYESRAFIEACARQSQIALVPEPPLPGGVLKTFRKGSGNYAVEVFGRSAHAGLEPEKGINAVAELARQTLAVEGLADPTQGTTVTVTTIQGGSGDNVVPDYARATFDVRFATAEEGERLDQALRSLSPLLTGTRLELTGGIDRPPMVRTEQSRALFSAARELAAEIRLELQEGDSGGGSDGNLTTAQGVPTLDGLGVDGGGAHTLDEYIRLDALVPRVALLARLIERL